MTFGEYPCLDNYRAVKACNNYCDGKKSWAHKKKKHTDWVKPILWILLALFIIWILSSILKSASSSSSNMTTTTSGSSIPPPVIINGGGSTASRNAVQQPSLITSRSKMKNTEYVAPTNCFQSQPQPQPQPQVYYPPQNPIAPVSLWSTSGCDGCPIPRPVNTAQTTVPTVISPTVQPNVTAPNAYIQSQPSCIFPRSQVITTTSPADCSLMRQPVSSPVAVY